MDRRERVLPQGDDDAFKRATTTLSRIDAHHHLSLGARESQRNRHVALNDDGRVLGDCCGGHSLPTLFANNAPSDACSAGLEISGVVRRHRAQPSVSQ